MLQKYHLSFVCAFSVLINFLPAKAQTGFTEVSQSIGVDFSYQRDLPLMGGGAAFFDYDNDGALDLYLIGGVGSDALYRNNGDGTFSDVSLQAGLSVTAVPHTMGVATGDIDNDGYRDVYVTTRFVRNFLLKNNGDGTFTDIAGSAGLHQEAWSMSSTFGDFNQDGFLDLYVVNYVEKPQFKTDENGNIIGYAHKCFPNYLYINNGDASFTEVASQLGVDSEGCGLATAFTDYDNDGDMDIYIANDFGEYIIPNVLYRNDGPGSNSVWKFTDVSQASRANVAMYGMGIAVGDYDEDGDFDYYVTNLGRNALLKNLGNGTFQDVTSPAGVTSTYVDGSLFSTSWGTAFFDYDNDTYLDLYVNNGYIPALDFNQTSETDPSKLYKNNGNGTFSDVSQTLNVDDVDIGRGFACGDYDNDGDVDFVLAVIRKDSVDTQAPRYMIFRNDNANGNHWLKIKLQGTASNRDGYGAHIKVVSNGRSWLREIDGGSSYLSQNASIAHFGLGVHTKVDSVIVYWPGGATKILENVEVDRTLEIIEDSSPTGVAENSVSPLEFVVFQNYPNPFNPETSFRYQLNSKGDVKIAIYNLAGQEVQHIDMGAQGPGEYRVKWDGKDRNALQAPSGVYIYRITFQTAVGIRSTTSKKMLLIK